MTELRVEYTALSELQAAKRNPKNHDLDSIRASLERFGVAAVAAVLNEKDGHMVAGHGRCTVLRAMHEEGVKAPARVNVREDGEWLVPVLRGVSFDTEQEAEAFLLADNRIGEAGGWDEVNLKALLSDLSDGDAVDGIGWSSEEINELLNIGGAADPYIGPTLDEYFETYQQNEIKQIVLYFPADEYALVLRRLARAMEKEFISSHTEAFVAMLDAFDEKLGFEPLEVPDEAAAPKAG